MPRAQRQMPLWQQIATHYKDQILRGELNQGDALPSIRDIRAEWGVSQGVAQQAIAHLHLAEHLVRTDSTGTYVDRPRAAISPQQRMRMTTSPASERVTVTAAGLVDAPDYIRPMFGMPEGSAVIRREEVTTLADGTPHMLSVTWVHPLYRLRVPELLLAAPLPDPRGAAYMVAERHDQFDPGDMTGGVAFECRLARDDGREMPALGLLESWAFVLAGVNGWRIGDDLLAYTEFILPPGQVVEADIEP